MTETKKASKPTHDLEVKAQNNAISLAFLAEESNKIIMKMGIDLQEETKRFFTRVVNK